MEEIISRHAKKAKKKIEGEKKSNIVATLMILDVYRLYTQMCLEPLRVWMPTKTKKLVVPAPPNQPPQKSTVFATPLTLPPNINCNCRTTESP